MKEEGSLPTLIMCSCLLYTSVIRTITEPSSATFTSSIQGYLEGNQQLLLGGDQHEDPAYFGSLTGLAATANGYIAADGNMREFYFWSKDGTLLAEVDCYDMFGTRYPWIEDAPFNFFLCHFAVDVYKRQVLQHP